LAAWPVVNGLVFVLRSPGLAFNEVVVALLDSFRALLPLRRFAAVLGTLLTVVIVIIVLSPLSTLWLDRVMALPNDLQALAKQALLFSLGLPLLALLQSLYQGIIVNSKKTRAITESVALYMGVLVLLLGVGVSVQRVSGLVVTIASMGIAGFFQVLWLRHRSRPAIDALRTAEPGGASARASTRA
jgi:hypothetical protein